MRLLCLLLSLLFAAPSALQAQQPTSLWKVVNSTPELIDGRPRQLISYTAPQTRIGELRLSCSQRRSISDSVILYKIAYPNTRLQAGVGTQALFLDRGRIVLSHPDLNALIQRCGSLPPGEYITHISFVSGDSTLFSVQSLEAVDSSLPIAGRLRRKANSVIAGAGRSDISNTETASQDIPSRPGKGQVPGASRRLGNTLRREDHIEVQPQQIGGEAYSALYYGDWFLGRYKIPLAGRALQTASAEYQTLQQNTGALVTSGLEDFRSTGEQVRGLFAARKESREISGDIDLLSAFGTGQEPGSRLDNNYTEIGGTVATEVGDIPVSIEGFYTTQDRHRQAKASYIRFHYDANRAQSELAALIATYRQKFGEAAARGAGLGQVYGSYTARLQGEKAAMMSAFGKEYGVNGTLLSSAGNTEELMSRLAADSASLVQGHFSCLECRIFGT